MARQCTRLEVAHDGTKWTVRELGIGRLTSHATEQEAKAAARAVANVHTPSELTVRDLNGAVASEERFPHPQTRSGS